jgi:Family of unknown function (DUF5519)
MHASRQMSETRRAEGFLVHLPAGNAYIVKVTGGQDDLRWDAFVTVMFTSGPVQERRSRYVHNPALFLDGRESAHLEAPGVIDLRISQKGWAQARDDYRNNPAIRRDPARRDWIELHLRSSADLDDLASLVAIAIAANS